MQPLTITGARTIIKFNNELFAAGFVLDYSVETSASVIQSIDSVLPQEIAPEHIFVSMSLKVYRTPENDPVTLGIAPGGDMSGPDYQRAFASSQYITVEIRDRVTDKTVLFLPKAFVTKRSGSSESEGILSETWSIKSIGFIGPGSQASSIAGVFSNKQGTGLFN